MPEIKKIYPEQIQIEVKFSVEELVSLRDFLSKCEFKAPLSEAKYSKASEFMEAFFPFICDVIDNVKGESDGD